MSVSSLIGSRLPLWDAAQKVTGRLLYTADLKLPRMLYGKVLFSPHAHAKIRSIDISKAMALPGVRAVVCCENTPDTLFNSSGEEIDGIRGEQIFPRELRYVGDSVAAVAADSEEIAAKALRLIVVDYELLPAVLQPKEALAPQAPTLHPGGNVAELVTQACGDVDSVFSSGCRVFEDCYTLPAIHHGAIETHASLADYDARGCLSVYTATQDAFAQRLNLARIFGLPLSRVRVIAPAIGGGFGGKIDLVTEPLAAALALAAGQPVRLVYSRREDIPYTRTRHEMSIRIKSAVDEEGRLLAQEVDALVNAGAYAGISSSVVWAMCSKLFKLTRTPHLRFRGTLVYTNTTPAGAMRGFGSPQLFFAQQRQLHAISQTLGLDMAAVLEKNLVQPQDCDPLAGQPHGNPRPLDCLQRGLQLFDWAGGLAQQRASFQEGGRYRIGVGLAAAAHGNGVYGIHPDGTGLILKLNEDGTAVLSSGCCDMGNGSVSLQQQLSAEILGLDPAQISCIQGDTETTLWDMGNYSSRGTFVSAQAAVRVAGLLREQILAQAAELLSVSADTLSLAGGQVHAVGGSSCPLAQVVAHARRVNGRELVAADNFASNATATSYGVHLVKVQVDMEEGAVKVLDYVAVHDVGRALNPLQTEGQIEGAVQMGLGYALCEAICRDSSGKVLGAGFRNYQMLRANQMPPIRIALVEEIEPNGPYGAKSVGECSVAPSPAAVVNAISAAIGKEVHHLPANPQHIRQLLSQG